MGLWIERAVLTANEGLGECNAGIQQNLECTAAGRSSCGCVDFSVSEGKVRTYLHVQVREDTAKLSHVRQLLYDYLRAGKAWKAPRTEEDSRNKLCADGRRCSAP